MPKNGWISLLTDPTAKLDSNTISIFTVNQLRTGVIVGFESGVPVDVLGTKPIQNRIYATAQQQVAQALGSPTFTPASSSANGFLNTIATRFYMDYVQVDNRTTGSAFVVPSSILPIPYYNLTGMTASQLDDQISAALTVALAEVAKIDKTALLGASAGVLKTNLFMVLTEALKDVPYGFSFLTSGSLYFNKIDHANQKYSWICSFGTDIRLTSSTNFPAAGIRLLTQQTQLDNAVLRTGNPSTLGSAKITQGSPRIMCRLPNYATGRKHKVQRCIR
jgi:hypothetical protein